MPTDHKPLAEKLGRISRRWISDGLPSREVLESTADQLELWKQKRAIHGLWSEAPLMLTATLDDGIGQGIAVIERFASVAGLAVQRIGLLQHPGFIVDQCKILQPDMLGLTVLQLDSDDNLAEVGRNCPQQTAIVAGGPAFMFDPEMGKRCAVDYISPNVAYFLDYILKWTPVDRFGL